MAIGRARSWPAGRQKVGVQVRIIKALRHRGYRGPVPSTSLPIALRLLPLTLTLTATLRG